LGSERPNGREDAQTRQQENPHAGMHCSVAFHGLAIWPDPGPPNVRLVKTARRTGNPPKKIAETAGPNGMLVIQRQSRSSETSLTRRLYLLS
jgi:hypothetical protein